MSIPVRIALLGLISLVFLFVFFPVLRQVFTRVLKPSETVTVPGIQTGAGGQELEIVTLLGFDAIPAILEPSFVSAEEAEAWMEPTEQVLGLSINGDHRAYSVRMLSRHEIVNDVVGDVPVAVTW